jgi:hypothetical protein
LESELAVSLLKKCLVCLSLVGQSSALLFELKLSLASISSASLELELKSKCLLILSFSTATLVVLSAVNVKVHKVDIVEMR